MTEIASPELALQKAIIDLLLGDTGVVAAIGTVDGKPAVFEEPPVNKDLSTQPWLYPGPINTTDMDSGVAVLGQIRLRIYVAARSRVEAWNAIHVARKAVHLKEPAIAGGFTRESPLRVTQAGDIIDPVQPREAFFDVTCVMMTDTFTFEP